MFEIIICSIQQKKASNWVLDRVVYLANPQHLQHLKESQHLMEKLVNRKNSKMDLIASSKRKEQFFLEGGLVLHTCVRAFRWVLVSKKSSKSTQCPF